jgi:hypothetical protein
VEAVVVVGRIPEGAELDRIPVADDTADLGPRLVAGRAVAARRVVDERHDTVAGGLDEEGVGVRNEVGGVCFGGRHAGHGAGEGGA